MGKIALQDKKMDNKEVQYSACMKKSFLYDGME